MAIEDDISVAANGDIRHASGTTQYSVLEFHRFLQDLADDETGTGDDILDITDDTPSDRSTDNIISLNAPYNIDDTLSQFLYDGSISQASGNTLYSGLVVVGAVPDTTTLMISQNNVILTEWWGATPTALNADAANNIIMRVMVKTRDAGSDIDGKRLRVLAREENNTYAEFNLTMGLGNSTAAVFAATDLNQPTAFTTIDTWDQFGNTEGYVGLDVDNDTVNEFYYSTWDIGGGATPASPTINDLYEYTKWAQKRGEVTVQLYGMNGELFRGITHEVTYTGESGTGWVQNEVLSWGSGATAGTGAVLATDDGDPSGTLWIQLLTGVVPSGTITGGGSTATTNVVTTRTISPAFIGASTGSAIIGAYGIGIATNDLSNSDQLFDLTNALRVPPNNVTFNVGGLVAAEDRVLVGPESGGLLDTTQFTLNGALTGGEATVTMNESVPLDTPATGTIRVLDNVDGTFKRVTYTGWSGFDFTGCTGAPAADNGANAFISYIDTLAGSVTESFTGVYQSPRTVFVRVRDGGGTPIKTFETTGTLGSGGGSTTAIRTSDA